MEHWQSPTIVLMSSPPAETMGWWNFVLQMMPEETWSALGLSLWPRMGPRREDQLQQLVARVASEVAFLVDLSEMPDPNGIGAELLEEVAHTRGKRINEGVERATELIRDIRQAIDADTSREAHRDAITEGLEEVQSLLWPEGHARGEKSTLSSAEIPAWSDRLREAATYAEILRLLWATSIIGQDRDRTASRAVSVG